MSIRMANQQVVVLMPGSRPISWGSNVVVLSEAQVKAARVLARMRPEVREVLMEQVLADEQHKAERQAMNEQRVREAQERAKEREAVGKVQSFRHGVPGEGKTAVVTEVADELAAFEASALAAAPKATPVGWDQV